MNRSICSLIALAALAVSAEAAAPTAASISANLGGVGFSASATGSPLTGAGKYGPYAVRVTGGGFTAGRYVTMTGTLAGSVAFRIDADSATGAVKLTYQGAKGPVTLTGKGAVIFK